MRARLYLDVDGVVNATNARLIWGDEESASVTLHSVVGPDKVFTVVWAPALIAALDDLRADFDLDLVWLSTWNEGHSVLTGLVPAFGGLERGRILPYHPEEKVHGEASGWWKARSILDDQAAAPAPFIWIDDVEIELHGYRMLNAPTGMSVLMIPTNTMAGLTPDDVTKMRSWLEQLSGKADR
ncbi:HAD domain-containing protein [Cryobacterium sp. GrIS_2_6]|uniref:HAD domain-containing protein n=1 Tax=Cryobacterium sp. GrIS_2_6 TaxID=3162785 RepID=UPI002E02244D|nr:hypothetical protein [Cryobacterium psychrotolerans]